jgi:plasmid stabilization system protein ParE
MTKEDELKWMQRVERELLQEFEYIVERLAPIQARLRELREETEGEQT